MIFKKLLRIIYDFILIMKLPTFNEKPRNLFYFISFHFNTFHTHSTKKISHDLSIENTLKSKNQLVSTHNAVNVLCGTYILRISSFI